MPRSLVLGNGNMLATLDSHLQLRDFYYPYVGMEDHTAFGNVHRVGFYASGKFAWISDGSWQISIDYDTDTLVGKATAKNEHLQLSVLFEDFVYTTHNIFFRKLTIENLSAAEQEVKVFFHHNFYIYGDKQKDTAQYEPELNAMLHYRGRRYFLVGGSWTDDSCEKGLGEGLDQYCAGKSKYHGKEGTYRDAEDGFLQGNPIDQGSVDSTIGFSQMIPPKLSAELFCYVAAGKSYDEIKTLHRRIHELGPQKILDHTRFFWRQWVERTEKNFHHLPEEVIRLYKQSLLIIRTQIDNRGAILAATDSDIMSTNRDNYNYMWPRDGALTSLSLSESGYGDPPQRFFEFCERVITDEGYALHKYNPDGSLGSSWHPKIKNGEIQMPIQEDESALILVALEKHYFQFRCVDVVQKYFNSLVLKIGRWLTRFVDEKTGLPLPSYDLWEQHRGVHTYTTACTIAGIRAAATLSRATGHYENAEKFEAAYKKMQEAFEAHLFSREHGRFIKTVQLKDGKVESMDTTIDCNLMFVFLMDVLPADDPRIVSTMNAIFQHLAVPGNIGGLARLQNDSYHFDYSSLSHQDFPGNPWIITTLWKARYLIRIAQKKEDLIEVIHILQWAVQRANPAGILPEQVHPVTGDPLFVAPLTWSHSAFVQTVVEFLKKMEQWES
jgi:glucoamylase